MDSFKARPPAIMQLVWICGNEEERRKKALKKLLTDKNQGAEVHWSQTL